MRAAPGGLGGIGLLILLALLLLLGPRPNGEGEAESPAAGGPGARAEVLRAIDGDTIEVDLDGVTEDVRYIGVDTPETVKPGEPVGCFGPEASRFNHDLVEGNTVRLRFDVERRDAYGRLLAYVYVGDTFVNGELVAGGFARTLEIEPNTAMADRLSRLEGEASTAGAGLWNAC